MIDADSIVPYMAGFFDGEGSIDIRYSVCKRGYERFHLRAAIGQKRRDPLDVAQVRWGGSISQRKIDGQWTWALSTKAAAEFLATIRPYSIVKREEIDIALAFQATFDRDKINLGRRGFPLIPDAVRQERYGLMIAMREARRVHGIYARDRNSVPATREFSVIPQPH